MTPFPGADSSSSGLWVRSDTLPTGGYGVAINVGLDRAWTLPPDRALRYAATCVRRATEAEHDAAVLTFLTASTGLNLSDEHGTGLLTGDLWPDRPVDHTDTEPLRFLTRVARRRSNREVLPLLIMQLDGRDAGELTPADLRDHATGVLQVLAAADLDAALARCLVSTVGVDQPRAAAMVDALADHWPSTDAPRRTKEPTE